MGVYKLALEPLVRGPPRAIIRSWSRSTRSRTRRYRRRWRSGLPTSTELVLTAAVGDHLVQDLAYSVQVFAQRGHFGRSGHRHVHRGRLGSAARSGRAAAVCRPASGAAAWATAHPWVAGSAEITENLGKIEGGVVYPPGAQPWEVTVPISLVVLQNISEVPAIRDMLTGQPITVTPTPGG